jgi:hypothetical protein
MRPLASTSISVRYALTVLQFDAVGSVLKETGDLAYNTPSSLTEPLSYCVTNVNTLAASDQIKEDEVDRSCSTNGGDEECV